MTAVADLLRELAAAGIRPDALGDRLRLRGPTGSLTPAIRAAAAELKEALLASLAPSAGRERSGAPAPALRATRVTDHTTHTTRVQSPAAIPNRRKPAAADSGPAFRLVRDAAGLRSVLHALEGTPRVALDVETTGLDPLRDRVRLLQLATADEVFVLDLFALGDASALWGPLAEASLVVHNAAFDLAFLWRLGFRPGDVRDLLLLSRLLTAGTNAGNALADLASRELGVTLDKGHQRADWSGPLGPEMLAYAASDAQVTFDLYAPVRAKVKEAGLLRVAGVERRCLSAVLWMATAGVGFDRAAWEALAVEAGADATRLAGELNGSVAPRKVPWNWASRKEALLALASAGVALPDTRAATLDAHPHPLASALRRYYRARAEKQDAERFRRRLDRAVPPREVPWNWNSPKQVIEVLGQAGCAVADTKDETLAAAGHPLADLIRRRREAGKRATTYGLDWLEHVGPDGRVYCSWKQLGAKTGRMASSDPNLQNIPSDARYRRCFVAPPGRLLVKADYSQIELRIAARVTGDEALLAAYAAGEDLHALTARRMTGKEDVSKEERQLAKPVNFGLVYGMSVNGLRHKARADYGLELSERDAARYRDAFFAAYPGIARWHAGLMRSRWRQVIGREPAEVRTLTGRRVVVEADTWVGARANYVIQGTGGDGIKLALALLWERQEECPGAFPVLAVHDEIVIECDEGQREAAADWLKRAMLDGMRPLIDPVPVEVEVKVARTWGGD